MSNAAFTAEEVAEAKRWGFNDVAAWKDAMKRSGMLEDMGYETVEDEDMYDAD